MWILNQISIDASFFRKLFSQPLPLFSSIQSTAAQVFR